jgi:hypothetical protein
MCSPRLFQHVLNRAFGRRCIAGAQYYVRVGPMLLIEGRITATSRLTLAISPSSIPMSRAHPRPHRFREYTSAEIELRRNLSSNACMIEGTPAIATILLIQKPGYPRFFWMRVMRIRASFISAPVAFNHSCRMTSARGSLSIGTLNAFATPMLTCEAQHPDQTPASIPFSDSCKNAAPRPA